MREDTAQEVGAGSSVNEILTHLGSELLRNDHCRGRRWDDESSMAEGIVVNGRHDWYQVVSLRSFLLAGMRRGGRKKVFILREERRRVSHGEKKKKEGEREREKQQDLPRISTAEGCQCRIFIGVSLHASGFKFGKLDKEFHGLPSK